MIRFNALLCTEDFRLMRILGLEINRVTQNSRYWDCRRSPINEKIPHLCLHKPKIAVVGSAVLKTRKWRTPVMCMPGQQEIFVKVEHESGTSCMIFGSFAEVKYSQTWQ